MQLQSALRSKLLNSSLKRITLTAILATFCAVLALASYSGCVAVDYPTYLFCISFYQQDMGTTAPCGLNPVQYEAYCNNDANGFTTSCAGDTVTGITCLVNGQ